jgi:hypothetical protein
MKNNSNELSNTVITVTAVINLLIKGYFEGLSSFTYFLEGSLDYETLQTGKRLQRHVIFEV